MRALADLPHRTIHWHPSIRLVSAEWPPIALFAELADPEDLADIDALTAVWAIGDRDRLDQLGRLGRVPSDERVADADAMSPFLYPSRGRFSEERRGAYYAAFDELTALAESLYHFERRMRESRAPSTDVDHRVLHATIEIEAADARGTRESHPALHDPIAGGNHASRALAATLAAEGICGLVYDSLRRTGGRCVAVFSPRCLTLPVAEEGRLRYAWDAARGKSVVQRLSSL